MKLEEQRKLGNRSCYHDWRKNQILQYNYSTVYGLKIQNWLVCRKKAKKSPVLYLVLGGIAGVFFMKSCSFLEPGTTCSRCLLHILWGMWKPASAIGHRSATVWLLPVWWRWNFQAFFQRYTPITRTWEFYAGTIGVDTIYMFTLANFQVVYCLRYYQLRSAVIRLIQLWLR